MIRIKHILTTVAFIFNDDDKLLFISKDGQNWGPIGGHIEAETIEDGIRREIMEEIGVDSLEYIDVLDISRFYDKNEQCYKYASSVLMELNQGIPTPSREISNYQLKWISIHELKMKPLLREVVQKAIYIIDKYKHDKSIQFWKKDWKQSKEK